MPFNTRRVRFLDAIGSPQAVRFIFVGMVVYALVIGGLMLGYANVQQCLARYSDESATASTIRVQAGAEDRKLNARQDAVDASDRRRIRANNDASLVFISNVAQTQGNPTREALERFRKVNSESAKIFDNNELERTLIAEERARVEKLRNTAPAPQAPSETC